MIKMIEKIEHGDVLELRLANPPVNAMNPSLVNILAAAITEAAQSHAAIVISGQPGIFSAGLDVPALLKLDFTGINQFWHDFFGLLTTVAISPVPIACAITGHSPAGGAVIAILADYRVMVEGKFVIGLNEVAVGLVPTANLQQSLARLVGIHQAGKLAIAGALIPSGQAVAIGMVDELAENSDAAIAHSIEWCQKHLALPRKAMLATRTIARKDLVDLWIHVDDTITDELAESWFTAETQAELKAMVAKLKSK
jgi:3,2-trans-enoyl-CoA isomerase